MTLLTASGGAALDASGGTVSPVTTGSGGSYSFTNLTPGSYTVQFAAPSSYLLEGSGLATWSGTVATPGPNASLSAGAYQPATLSGVAFVDANGNGVKDTGESGLSGVTVTVIDANGNTAGTATTGSGGGYSFTNLAPGTYTDFFEAPSGGVYSG